jgi:ribosomal protein S18 acetylase RimI-like enzyme
MSDSGLRLFSEPDASEADKDIVRSGIDERNMVLTGRRDYRPITLFVRDAAGAIQGGLLGEIWAGWCEITYLWVAEAQRGQGQGTRLLRACEELAAAAGCAHIHLNSFDFQAPHFYQRFGYQIFAELPDYPPGHTLYFFKKDL